MGLRGIGANPLGKRRNVRRKRESWDNPALSAAERIELFIGSLKLTSGNHAGKQFRLRDWQKRDLDKVYRGGVRTALWTMGRKNGKTQLATGLAAGHLFGPMAEPRGEVYSAASDRNQAGRIFRELEAMIMADPKLHRRCNIIRHAKKIEVLSGPGEGSIYEALSSDAKKAHSLSPSFVVCDELAQWPHRELYDNLVTGTGARENPIVVVISTMSNNPLQVMSELVDYGEKVNAGIIEDASFVSFIYTTPMNADIWEEGSWYASNPALGDFRSLEEMRKFAHQSQRIPAKEAVFRNLYLNQPVEAEHSFIPRADWDACHKKIELKDLYGRKCYGGLDLSSTGKNDLTSLVLIFPMDDGTKVVIPHFWACSDEGALEQAESRDRVPYRLWANQGHLTAIPRKVMDYDFLAEDLARFARDFDVQAIAFDRYKVKFLIQACEERGIDLTLVPHAQTFLDMSPSIDALEDEILTWRLQHNGNPVLTWNMSNVKIEVDAAGNRKFSKRKSTGRIDGAVALAMAAGLIKSKELPKKAKFQAFLV